MSLATRERPRAAPARARRRLGVRRCHRRRWRRRRRRAGPVGRRDDRVRRHQQRLRDAGAQSRARRASTGTSRGTSSSAPRSSPRRRRSMPAWVRCSTTPAASAATSATDAGRPPRSGPGLRLAARSAPASPALDVQGGPVPAPGRRPAAPAPSHRGRSRPRGAPAVAYEEVPGQFDDGTPYSPAAPRYSRSPAAPLRCPAACCVSPRVAPPVFGLGLLEARERGHDPAPPPIPTTPTATA